MPEKATGGGRLIASAQNIKAMLEDADVLRMIRRRMGLGDTLGALPPECGGTGTTSPSAGVGQRIEREVWPAGVSDGAVKAVLPGIKAIAEGAFRGCSTLREVQMPDVESIGTEAFSECTTLASARIPATATVGTRAFGGCTAMSGVEAEPGATFGARCFGGCTGIVSASFPGGCTFKGSDIFVECPGLREVSFGGPGGVTHFAHQTNDGVLGKNIQNGGKLVVRFAGDVKCNSGVVVGIGRANVSMAFDLTGCSSWSGGGSIAKTYMTDSAGTLYMWVPSTLARTGTAPLVSTSMSRANTSAKVFCEAAKKPDGWNADIADGPMTEIAWGATYEQFKQAAGI